MITTTRPGLEEQTPELSEESEEEILRMVEEQLDRPNPPDTKVLYRRAMHFVDRDVRHLSLQQFNAKFPLQVKRRRAMSDEAASGVSGASSGNGTSATATTNGDGETATESDVEAGPGLEAEESNGGDPEQRDVDSSDGDGATEDSEPARQTIRREKVRSALLEYAKLVSGAETRAELVKAVPQVEEYVDRVIEEA